MPYHERPQAPLGRLHFLNIWPLSQGEIGGSVENLIPKRYHDPEKTVSSFPRSNSTRQGHVARIIIGGFPIAISRSSNVSRNRWFDDYIMQSIERDSVELVRIRQRQILHGLFSTLASQTTKVSKTLPNAVIAVASKLKTRSEDNLKTRAAKPNQPHESLV